MDQLEGDSERRKGIEAGVGAVVGGEGSVETFLPPAVGAGSPGSHSRSNDQSTTVSSPNGPLGDGGVDGGVSLSSHVVSGASVASHKRVGRSLFRHAPMSIDVMFAPSLNPQFTDIPLMQFQPTAPSLSERPSQVLK